MALSLHAKTTIRCNKPGLVALLSFGRNRDRASMHLTHIFPLSCFGKKGRWFGIGQDQHLHVVESQPATGGRFAGQLETQRLAAKASQDAYLRSNHEAWRARWDTGMEVMFKNKPLQMCIHVLIIFRVIRTVIPCSFFFTRAYCGHFAILMEFLLS